MTRKMFIFVVQYYQDINIILAMNRGIGIMAKTSPTLYFMKPKYFFVTSGAATSNISALNAFDNALIDAGIAQCNLVPVSSIIPANAVEIEPIKIPAGSVTYVVLARTDGQIGETIGAGIAWGFAKNKKTGERYGFVVESHGYRDKDSLKLDLSNKINEMANSRKMVLENLSMRVESLNIKNETYGCVIAAFVYVFDQDAFVLK